MPTIVDKIPSMPSAPERPSPLGNWGDVEWGNDGRITPVCEQSPYQPQHRVQTILSVEEELLCVAKHQQNKQFRASEDNAKDVEELNSTMKPSTSKVALKIEAAEKSQDNDTKVVADKVVAAPLPPVPTSFAAPGRRFADVLQGKHRPVAAPIPSPKPTGENLQSPPPMMHQREEVTTRLTRVGSFPLAPPPVRMRGLMRENSGSEVRFVTCMRRWYSSAIGKWGPVAATCPPPPYQNSPYAHLYPEEFQQWVEKVGAWYAAEVRPQNVPAAVYETQDVDNHPCSVLRYINAKSNDSTSTYPSGIEVHHYGGGGNGQRRGSNARPNFNNSYSHDFRVTANNREGGLERKPSNASFGSSNNGSFGSAARRGSFDDANGRRNGGNAPRRNN